MAIATFAGTAAAWAAGACCVNGVCSVVADQASCAGTYLGDNSTCGDAGTGGYSVIRNATNRFEDIAATGTVGPTQGDDNVSATLALPFTFTYFGVAQTQYRYVCNGFMTFGTLAPTGVRYAPTQPEFPGAVGGPRNCIAIREDDLNANQSNINNYPGPNSATILFQTLGAAPNRRFVLQWNNIPKFVAAAPAYSCQIVLFETTNVVELRWKDYVVGADADVGMGINNAAGTAGINILPSTVPAGASTIALIPGNPCAVANGACCLTNSCATFNEQVCVMVLAGAFGGVGTSCSPNPCSPPGACCVAGSCSIRTVAGCTAANGVFLGEGTDCAANNCQGACCRASGTCSLVNTTGGSINPPVALVSSNCAAADEVYHAGQACAQAACPPGGKCCFNDGSCQVLTSSVCENRAGGASHYGGDNTNCAAPPVGSPNTYTRNPNLFIPDGTGSLVMDTLNVPDNYVVGDVEVHVEIPAHTFIGDLIIRVGHGSTTVTMWNRQCGGNNGLLVTFDDQGVVVLCAQPTTGTYQSAQLLSAFNGQPVTGDWTLFISDNAAIDTGTLTTWSLIAFAAGEACKGACCTGALGTTCSLLTEQQCMTATGMFHGVSSVCTPTPCEPTGACCSNGACTIQTVSDCAEMSGMYLGDGAACSPNNCQGACCRADGSCSIANTTSGSVNPAVPLLSSGCSAANEVYHAGQACAQAMCAAAGRCCQSNGMCSLIVETGCQAPNVWGGAGTDCSTIRTYATSPSLFVPDFPAPAVMTTITVPDGYNVSDVDVRVDFSPLHTFIGDLVLQLAHGGTTITLFNRQCGASDGMRVVFDDGGVAFNCTSPVIGFNHYLPTAALSVFNGQPVGGDWTLIAQDFAGIDTGTIANWAIIAQGGSPPCQGACCSATMRCTLGSRDDCMASGGTYHGDAVGCSPTPCAPNGACCAPDSTCSIQGEADCMALNGQWHDGQDCATGCPQSACCAADHSCSQRSQFACTSQSGTWSGPSAVACSNPDPCRGQCCLPNGICFITDMSDCTMGQGGGFGGNGTTCDSGTSYTVSNANNTLEDISTTGTVLVVTSGTNDDGSSEVAIGFDFTFFGNRKQNIRIGTNGYMTFSSVATEGNNPANAAAIPAAAPPNDYIAPLWDNLNNSAMNIRFEKHGTAPNQRFIVQWTNIPRTGLATALHTFQALLYESTNRIEFRYARLPAGRTATIGVENATGTAGSSVPDAALAVDTSFLFTPQGLPCPQPVGGCCIPGPSCQADQTAEQCAQVNGVWQGGNVACGNCPLIGSCCLPADGTCVVYDTGTCLQETGGFTANAVCGSPNPCKAKCCKNDGTCAVLTPVQCMAASGQPGAPGSDCSSMDCPHAGACCHPDGLCEFVILSLCNNPNWAADVPCQPVAYTTMEGVAGIEDVTSGTALVVTSGTVNDGSGAATIPFAFRFFGADFTDMRIGTNGYITFSTVLTDGNVGGNVAIPTAAIPNKMIAPFWDDLNNSAPNHIFFDTRGIAPNRRFIIAWNAIPRLANAASLNTFEVILYESSNLIEFRYGPIGAGGTATIGVENANGSAGSSLYGSPASAGPAAGVSSVLFVPQNTCPQPLHACCAGNQGCSTVEAATCHLAASVWQDANVSCMPINPCVPRGACCDAQGNCQLLSMTECGSLPGGAGDYRGDGTGCSPNICRASCCKFDGTCATIRPEDCPAATVGLAGVRGSDCTTATCAPAGRCCLSDGSCQFLTQARCESAAIMGTYGMDNVRCTGYTLAQGSTALEDISVTGMALVLGGDDAYAFITLPFDFNFFGTLRTNGTQAKVSTNGFVTFNIADVGANFTNVTIPTAANPNDMIAPLWDDLFVDNVAMEFVYTEVRGVAPGRRLIIQWNNVENLAGTANTTFQAILSEGSGSIEFRYSAFTAAFTPTVGIENATGTDGTMALPFNTTPIAGSSIVLAPITPCPQQQGACCSTLGQCTVRGSLDCAASGGMFHLGEQCPNANCVPMGPCCAANGQCAVTTQANCLATAGQTYGGNFMTCAQAPCVVGSCCSANPCTTLTQAGCAQVAGSTWQAAQACDGSYVGQTGLPAAILDNATFMRTLTIPAGAGTITDLNVTLDVSHTFYSDLTFKIKHNETNTEVVLADGAVFVSGNDLNGIYVLDDSAGTTWDAAAATNPVPAGTYRPRNPLTVFNGQNIAGTWTLTVADDAGGDVGTLRAWSLRFNNSTDACVAPCVCLGDMNGSGVVDGDDDQAYVGCIIAGAGNCACANIPVAAYVAKRLAGGGCP